MDRNSFDTWLDLYGKTWMNRDADAAASLYADDATYQVTPFDEPLKGRAAIYEYWCAVTTTEENIAFDYEILAVTEHLGIARWRASFVRVPPKLATKLDGIFVIAMNGSGKCASLREWWVKRQ